MDSSSVQRSVILSFLAFVVFVSVTGSGAQAARPSGPGASAAQNVLPVAKPAPAPAAIAAREMRLASDVWVPPDIDASVPAVSGSQACPLADVLDRAGKRVKELVGNLDRFTATEAVQHYSVNGSGTLGKAQNRKFEYLVSIGPAGGGYLGVHEYRSHVTEPEQFPDRVATEGTPSLVLVFHPAYVRDFDVKCEGLGEWRGKPAWQVRFEQIPNRENRMSNVVVKNKAYNIRLRGRAWILADSYQVARMETDLADTIPAIKLRVEHISVEYRPVDFPSRHTELWLPSSAELYMDFSGRRFYRKHSFNNFTLFSVDVQQQFAEVTPQ